MLTMMNIFVINVKNGIQVIDMKKKEKPVNVHVGDPFPYANCCYEKKCSECNTDIYFMDRLKKIDKYLCINCAIKTSKEKDPEIIIHKQTRENLLKMGFTEKEIDETHDKIREFVKNPDKDKPFQAS